MKTLRLNYLLLLFFVPVSIFSCTKESDPDEVLPQMTMEQPVEGDTLTIGDEFHMEMDITDNRELKECAVEILNNFDAHHKYSVKHEDNPWHFTKTFDMTGLKSFRVHEHVIVPDSVDNAAIARGEYHYIVNCTDKAGNVATKVVSFYID